MSKRLRLGFWSETEKAHEQMIHVRVHLQRVRDIRCDDSSLGLQDSIDFIENWCEENTDGVWSKKDHIHYYFEDETDAMAFKLMWS